MATWYDPIKTTDPLIKLSSQEVWEKEFGDYQRWVVDAIEVRVFLTKTSRKIAISINVWNGHIGMMMWQDFWKYDLGQMSQARNTFKKIRSIIDEVLEEFKSQEIPNLMVWATLRNKCRKIDREKLARTNIPHINYSHDLDYVADWRSSIYGTRYPTHDSSGY